MENQRDKIKIEVVLEDHSDGVSSTQTVKREHICCHEDDEEVTACSSLTDCLVSELSLTIQQLGIGLKYKFLAELIASFEYDCDCSRTDIDEPSINEAVKQFGFAAQNVLDARDLWWEKIRSEADKRRAEITEEGKADGPTKVP